MGSSGRDTNLARGAIGLTEVLFQSITHMAPAAAVAFSIIVGAGYAGGALPLSVVIALIACLCVAYSIGELARHLPSAGGLYTYTARGLHHSVGFLVAWGYALVEPLVAPLLYLILGIVVAGTLDAEFDCGICRSDQWWIWSILAAILVLALGYFGIQLSTRTGTILGVFEIGVFTLVSIWLIAKADNNTLSVFLPSSADVPGFEGLSGVFAGSIYAILAFIGFEAAAPLAEEARDPTRTIRKAVIFSCIGIGAFYIFTTYAATVFFGPEEMGGFAAFGGGNPWDGLARVVWGAGWVLVFLAIVNSAIANSNAGANAATRTWYAMGRIRLLPSALDRVHPHWKSPYVAVWAQFVVGVGAAMILGFVYEPLPAFIFIATLVTAIVVLIYVAVNLSCIALYLRDHRDEFNPFKHLVVPIVGILFFIPGWLTAMGITVFSFIAPLSGPAAKVGLVVVIWYVIGIGYLIYLISNAPERVRDTAKVFLEENPEVIRAGEPGPPLVSA